MVGGRGGGGGVGLTVGRRWKGRVEGEWGVRGLGGVYGGVMGWRGVAGEAGGL